MSKKENTPFYQDRNCHQKTKNCGYTKLFGVKDAINKVESQMINLEIQVKSMTKCYHS